MFVFSNIHKWQNDPAVLQILVFPDQETRQLFDKAFAERIKTDGVDSASDAGIGATYRLRAVKNGDSKYVPVIRAGAHGGLLWEGEAVGNKQVALKAAMRRLYSGILDYPMPRSTGVSSYVEELVDENFMTLLPTASGNYDFEEEATQ